MRLFTTSQSTESEDPQSVNKETHGADNTDSGSLFPWQNRRQSTPSRATPKAEVSGPPPPQAAVSSVQPDNPNQGQRSDIVSNTLPTGGTQQLQSELNKCREEVNQWKSENLSLKEQLADRDKELSRLPELQKNIQSLQSELAELRHTHSAAVAGLQEEKEQNRKYQDQLNRLDDNLKLGEDSRAKAVQEREEMRAKLDSMEAVHHQKATSLQGELDSLKLKVSTLQSAYIGRVPVAPIGRVPVAPKLAMYTYTYSIIYVCAIGNLWYTVRS